MILHGYWRSSAAYRVRIGLNLKGLEYREESHSLLKGEHRNPAYLAKVPQGLVPALEHDGIVLGQSLAILEWLDESYPEPPLLPADATGRAIVRAMALAVAADIHPVNNLRVGKHIRERFGADDAAVTLWMQHWMAEGFVALETMLTRHGGRYAYGDMPGLADIVLVPQWYNAERYRLDLSPYPKLATVIANAKALPAFARAAPENHPDAH